MAAPSTSSAAVTDAADETQRCGTTERGGAEGPRMGCQPEWGGSATKSFLEEEKRELRCTLESRSPLSWEKGSFS